MWLVVQVSSQSELWKYLYAGHGFNNPADLLMYVTRCDISGKYTCGICKSFSHAGKSHVRNHVESKHFPDSFTYECNQCDKTFSTKNGVANHRSVAHKFTTKF